jgi:hypothetical protein
MTVIPALGKWKKEDNESKASLSCIVKTLSENNNKKSKCKVLISLLGGTRNRQIYIERK